MTASSKTAATASAVGAHLEALNLAGVAFAARRLLGKDPAAVTGQFAMWARSGSGGLPTLTGPMWTALAPLQIGRPASTNAAVCDMVLVGREPDAVVAREAAADGAAEGKTMFGRAPLPADVEHANELVSTVKAYWRVLATVYDEVRARVILGDQQGAVDAMRQHAPQMRAQVKTASRLAKAISASEVQAAAASVSDSSLDASVPPDPHGVIVTTTPADPAVNDMGAPVRSVIEPVPSGSLHLTDDQAEAFARRQALATADTAVEPPARQVEVLSDRAVRNHPFLPILFLVVVSGVALYVLFAILNDPTNPLLQ